MIHTLTTHAKAGTLQQAMLTPDIPAHTLPPPPSLEHDEAAKGRGRDDVTEDDKMSSAEENIGKFDSISGSLRDIQYYDVGDADLMQAAESEPAFMDIDRILVDAKAVAPVSRKAANSNTKATPSEGPSGIQDWTPIPLRNGKWACNHTCKDKVRCRHLCCRDGLDQPPKRPKRALAQTLEADSFVKDTKRKLADSGNGLAARFSYGSRLTPPPNPSAKVEWVDLTANEGGAIHMARPKND